MQNQQYPGSQEFDFNGDTFNQCFSASFRWLIEDQNVDDYSQVKQVFVDMRKQEQRELRQRAEQIQRARHDLQNYIVDLRGLFQLERWARNLKE